MPPDTPITIPRSHYDQIVADHERIGGICDDIGDIKGSIREVADSLRRCVDDHETRIRAIEKAQIESAIGWKTTARIGAIAGGVVGMICGIIAALAAVFSIMRGG